MKDACYFAKMLTRWAGVTLSVSLLLFLVAGGTKFPSLRYYLATFAAVLLATMFSIDRELAEERSRPIPGSAATGRFSSGLWFLATLMIAALDIARLHLFPPVSSPVRMGSLVLFSVAMALQMWAMLVNPFFSPEIRLQSERGHRLVTIGPYRFLRHPGYLAMLISVPASALAIGSWLALIPGMAFCLVILKRVRIEEDFLQGNLAGYSSYVQQVRGRLFPRITVCHGVHSSITHETEPLGSHRRWL